MLKLIAASMLILPLVGCVKTITTEPGHETVLVDKPYIFGHGGVQSETQKTGLGWYWWSTEPVHVLSYDFKIDEPFDDLPTQKQSLIDFNSYLKLEILDPVKMVKDFRYIDDGKSLWYISSLKEQYRTIVRNVARNYTMEDMLTNSQVVQQMETEIRNNMDVLIKEIGIPVKLKDLSLGAIRPNQAVMSEIDNTAANQQRIKTEKAREEAEQSRKAAELARASADKAYQDELNLTSEQIVRLQTAKMYSEACAKSANCIVMQEATPVSIKTK